MDEHRFEGEIRHAFERYEMSAEATLPVGRAEPRAGSRRARWLPVLTVPVIAAAVGFAVVLDARAGSARLRKLAGCAVGRRRVCRDERTRGM